MNYYEGSSAAAVIEFIPNYDWQEWRFQPAPRHFWENKNNHRRYMQWLGEQLGFQTPEDWYRVTAADFQKNHGYGFLNYYQNSPSAAVMAYLPKYQWEEWLFISVPQNFWDEPANRHRYMAWLGERLNFRIPEDWYSITSKDFQKNYGGSFLLYYQGSPSAAVMDYLSDYNWKPEKFSEGKKRQKQLYRIVNRIFSEYEVKWDFKHPEIRFSKTRRPMELDVFVPSLNLAFEYQGEQHALPISIWGGIAALKETQQRDKEKRQACKKHGITLIEVPHSWNGTEDMAIEMLSHQFIKKVKDRLKGTEQIQAALKAINTYCKRKQRKERKKRFGNHQANFDFNAR